jgi:hypothetical protein
MIKHMILHQPLNRQSEAYAREGVDLPLSTLADDVGARAACPGAARRSDRSAPGLLVDLQFQGGDLPPFHDSLRAGDSPPVEEQRETVGALPEGPGEVAIAISEYGDVGSRTA